MGKKILLLVLVSAVLMIGCYDRNSILLLPYTQISVCTMGSDYEQYGVTQYVDSREIIIPALEQKFIPQGIAYWHGKDWLILSGYYKPAEKETGATLLAVNATTGKLERVFSLTDSQGKKLDGHFSGVAVTENDLYLTHGAYLLQVPLWHMESPFISNDLYVTKKHRIGIKDGSCSYSDGILWVCEHYRKPEQLSETDEEGFGQMVGYRLDETGILIPYCMFQVPEKVQGTTITLDGRLVFSTSYGRTNASQLLVFEDPRENTPDGYVFVSGHEVPMWTLDVDDASMNLTAPPMSEGCCSVGKSIYLIFESAAYYYRAFDPNHRSVDPTDRIWEIVLVNEK